MKTIVDMYNITSRSSKPYYIVPIFLFQKCHRRIRKQFGSFQCFHYFATGSVIHFERAKRKEH